MKITKAPYPFSVPLTTDQVFYKGICYQIGDIVGLKDSTDGKMYYAQLRGFLQDQYCEKSAVITWLLPSKSSPESGFDLNTYYLGPEEDIPRKMKYMEFICHASSTYFQNKNFICPTLTMKPECGFIWTNQDDGIVLKLDECKSICSEVRMIKVDDNGNELSESDDNEEIKIAQD